MPDPSWQQRRDVLTRRHGEAWLVLPLAADEPMVLEGVGAVVWEACATPTGLAELTAAFAAATDADPDVVAADLQRFLDDLVAAGALEVA